jgi:hypothetical chaperone protein
LLQAFRSILCYVSEDVDGLHADTQVYCGPAAIAAFLEHGEQARLIQSIKTFLSSTSFSRSVIHGREYTLEQMVADFLRGLLRAAQWPDRAPDLAAPGVTVSVGRPVRFAGGGEDALAEVRLRKAFAAAGFGRIELALEPQAAAYFFARRLREPATVLVADFGGGTSDFSVVRFDPVTGRTQALGHAGVGIAGDTLDYRIIDHVIAPAFGKGSRFRPEDKWLEVPKWIYFEFEQWIAQDVAAIESACSASLASAALSEPDISLVFMTGGTAFVPLIRQRFETRFGRHKIMGGDEFVSVGSGLALLARERAGA